MRKNSCVRVFHFAIREKETKSWLHKKSLTIQNNPKQNFGSAQHKLLPNMG